MSPARPAEVVIVGGGVVGLCTSLLLARDGHRVRLLERDPAPPPPAGVDAWKSWKRRGVYQFHLLHGFLPRFRELLDTELPDVTPALEAGGALRFNRLQCLPGEVTGGWRPGDERFEAVTGRRPMVEATLARIVAEQPGIEVLRGVAVRGLLGGDRRHPAAPHVTGVVTDDGSELRGDLIIDVSGRRTQVPTLLAAIGATVPPEERQDIGNIYYSRHFQSSDGSIPDMPAPLLQHYESISILTAPGDNGTWGVVIFTSGRDRAARAVRDPDIWSRVVKSYPMVAHWLDGEPITGIDVMAGIHDVRRAWWSDDAPVATGLLAVGDAWACSNPALGRGASIGLIHAVALRDVLRDVPASAATELAARWHEVTEATVAPLYVDALNFSRHRAREIEAQVNGQVYEPADPGWHAGKALAARATSDPDLLRAGTAIATMLARPVDVMSDPAIRAKLQSVAPAPALPGLTRSELVNVLTS